MNKSSFSMNLPTFKRAAKMNFSNYCKTIIKVNLLRALSISLNYWLKLRSLRKRSMLFKLSSPSWRWSKNTTQKLICSVNLWIPDLDFWETKSDKCLMMEILKDCKNKDILNSKKMSSKKRHWRKWNKNREWMVITGINKNNTHNMMKLKSLSEIAFQKKKDQRIIFKGRLRNLWPKLEMSVVKNLKIGINLLTLILKSYLTKNKL